MIAPRWRKVVRDATTHLPRTLLVACAIATSLGGAGTILTSWALVRRATQEGYLASNPAAATLRFEPPAQRAAGRDTRIGAPVAPGAALLARVRAVPGVRDAQWRRTANGPVLVQGSWRPALLFATDAPSTQRIGLLQGAGGRWPPPHGTIALERSSLDVAGSYVGDTIALTASDGTTRPAMVSALVRDVSLAPGWMEHVVYLWASTATLAQLGFDATPNELQLTVSPEHPTRDDVRRVALAVRRMLDSAGVTVHDVDVPEPGEHIHAPQMDSLLLTQGAFGVLALLVGAFLVVNLMTAMLAQQGREIGVMKVLGGQPLQLTTMYMAFALGTGAVATALALPVAVTLGRRYAALRAEMLNFDVAPYGMPWWSVALVVAVGLLLPMAAAWFPVRRA
ncbi:MAG TPA: ABC transporter permease, partial [Gemmatimonadaceae bacterium]|nr:ABC transporter permease [Gemmatimonadaceae bacterium]